MKIAIPIFLQIAFQTDLQVMERGVNVATSIDQDELNDYIERLEHRIEVLSSENAALVVTLNKIMGENLKLKAEKKTLEMRIAAMNSVSEINYLPENQSE